MARSRTTREESHARTRAELLDAGARVFARRGYDGASVAEIAEEAGYSHGAVYSSFEGKQDLFLTLYERWVAKRVAEIEDEWSEHRPLARAARAAADAWRTRFDRDPEAFLLRLEFSTRVARDPQLRERLGRRVGAVPLAIERLIERLVQQEGRELALPAHEVALGLQALSLGLGLEALSNPEAIRPGLAGELAAVLTEAVQAPRPSATT